MKLIKITLIAASLSVATASADESKSWQESWYIGGAIGQSKLNPDGGQQWEVTDEKSVSKKLYTGVNVTKDTGIEAFWNDFGDAELKSASQSGSVNYKAIGLAGVYKPPINIGGIQPLGKLGVAKFETKDKGELNSKQLNDVSMFLGLGAEYPLSDNVNLRAEYERFDKDIQHYNLGLNWRPLQRNRSNIVEKIAIKEPEPVQAIEYTPPPPKVIPAVKQYTPPPAPAYVPPAYVAPVYVPPPKPKMQTIHSSLTGGSNFNTGSAELTYAGQRALSQLASDLQADGMKVKAITIIGHTDNVGNDSSNLALSLARANSVADYLQNQGVNRNLMHINGKGESQPIASNRSSQGRAQNRRVEIKIQGMRTVIKQ